MIYTVCNSQLLRPENRTPELAIVHNAIDYGSIGILQRNQPKGRHLSEFKTIIMAAGTIMAMVKITIAISQMTSCESRACCQFVCF